ncbi:hypothetical protein M0638_08130 [Roseomonas sp. NAR14]|uniref:Uncharacterized protein n=1 Tax=Roseomonas acroporae TaxID=2937791 RepID=A0A9X1Y5I2_9PROT|nr:hypothetical protein [Roseomonas acroporae]MCK8784344.1 hypothetical protein [Roseomonas acroporae]
MGRITVVQFREYRQHQLELLDHGKAGYQVIIHPPARLGGPREVPRGQEPRTFAEMIQAAKEEIDVIMGPRPPPRMGWSRG